MTTYYEILDDPEVEMRWYLRGPVDAIGSELDEREFTYGQRLDIQGVLFILIREEGRPLDFTLADSDMPVVRREIGSILAELAPNDIQLFPAHVEGEDDDYDILNVISVVDCLDVAASDVTYWRANDGRPDKVGEYRMIGDLKVDRSRVGGAEIFRVRNWEISLIVTDKVRDALLSMNTTGITFRPV